MRDLTIYRRYFYDSKCYKNAPDQTMYGIQVHSTGANNPHLRRYVQPDDGRIGVNANGNHHNKPDATVCASAYIGRQADGTVAVYQTLPWQHRCWLAGTGSSGTGANKWMAGFEICEDGLHDEEYFNDAVMDKSVLLCAYLCRLYGVDPDQLYNGFNVISSHAELHDAGYASNHGDIDHWLRVYNMTMADYRAAVRRAYDEGVNVTVVDCDQQQEPLYEAVVTCSGKYLNLREGKSTNTRSIHQLYKGTAVAVLDDSDRYWWRVRQDGITGYAMAVGEHGDQWLTREHTEPEPVDPVDPDGYKLTQAERDALKMASDIILKYIELHT